MASRFYALMFVALTGILGMVSPPDLSLMTAQAQTNQDRKAEADRLLDQGVQQYNISQFEGAFQSWQQALTIYREIKDRRGEGQALGNLGNVYDALGKYDKVIEFQMQRLEIAREIKDSRGEGQALGNLGNVYNSLGKYDKAIKYLQQALTIYREIKDRLGEGKALGNLGNVYNSLGKYDKAIEFQLQSLAIAREIKDRRGEGQSLGNLGNAYDALGKYDKVIEFQLQSLEIAREIKDRLGEGQSLGSLGSAYDFLGKYDKAIEFQLQSLAIAREIKDRYGEMYRLGNLATTYVELNRDQEAVIFFQQALTIAREIGDRNIEGYALAALGNVLSKAKRPELAILFYKQSINVREAIRKDISKLDRDIQKSYLATVEYTYRKLADLLLKQDRILEAQQVLDLLKVEELNEYLRTPTRSSQTEEGTELRTQEKTFIALALELDELQKRKLANNITAAEQERLNKLVKSEQEQQNQFIAFLDSDPVQKLVAELSLKEKQQNVDITNNFQNLRTDILNKYPNAVLLYPLILEDRLELILITAKTTPIRRTIYIKREKLNQEITNFLAGLRDPSSQDIQKPAQQMYTWLIKPFETELAELKIDTIVYAPDAQLRYIPLAALHDGKQWLIEKYRVNNITAASLTKFNKPPIATPKIFAGAFGNLNKQGFSGLPATLAEVKKIADRFPNTTTLVETAFTKELTTTNSNSYTILHLATHGQLSTGDPKDSFILFGDGEKATISDIRKWALTNVDLVVLSACQSGLGSKLGNGVEILGLGYQMQAAGARMSIASLWKVSDAGTEKLMDAFYTAIKTGKVSNVEALRQAQVAMITDNYEGLGETRGIVSIEARPRSTSSTAPTKISHPYYWAAFILIGNGL